MTRRDVEEKEYQLIEGIKTSDVRLLDSLLHDNLLFIAPNGFTVTKQMDLNSHRAGAMKVDHLVAAFEEVNIVGDNAVVVVVYNTRGIMLDKAIEGQFRYIRIWKQFDDGLKVIAGSCQQLPPNQ